MILFKTIVRAVLMYGCEAWKLTKREAKEPDAFQYKCIKRILRISWPRTISCQRIHAITGVNRASDEIRCRRWNRIGHIIKNRKELRKYSCSSAISTLEGIENKQRLQTLSIDNAWSNKNFLFYLTFRMLQHTSSERRALLQHESCFEQRKEQVCRSYRHCSKERYIPCLAFFRFPKWSSCTTC